jgi:SAM-dependent methyltransferase
MSSVEDHYAKLLAPVYTWMVGGADAAFALGQSDLAGVVADGTFAIDLGAGFGMHAIPLARQGWQVLAVDTSSLLLEELKKLSAGLPIQTRCCDLLQFSTHPSPQQRADLVLCMGDTLTHLPTMEAVETLSRLVASHLAPGGRFVATFRDYTRLPVGEARFIPVRADAQRILMCFLEDCGAHVQVHDLLHERQDGKWTSTVSSYRKLRVTPDEAAKAFSAAGLRTRIDAGPRGMVRLIADA